MITLNAGPLAASLTTGTDPINDAFTIALVTSGLTVADAGSYSIVLTVTVADWSISSVIETFTIELIDACASVSINTQVITFPDQVIQDFSLAATSITRPAFTDSVDSAGTYSKGFCGEKRISFDGGTPSFMSLTPGLDPINDVVTIDLDTSGLTIADA